MLLLPSDIAKKTVETGKSKANLTTGKMLLLGIFAGIFIALAGVGASIGSFYGGKLAGALIFPIGLAMVIIAGSELFTGNNLMIMSWIKGEITLIKLLKNWILVFFGNFIGASLVALLVVYSGVLDPLSDSVVAAAVTKNNLGFIEALIRGVFCNFLVCIAVWMAFSAKTTAGKIIALFGPVFLFVLCSFEHSVANMFYGPAGIFMAFKNGVAIDGLNFLGFLWNNLLPVTIGNILGGAGIVGLGYYLIYLRKNKD